MKKVLLTAFVLLLMSCLLLTSCGNKENEVSTLPRIEISDDGFWVINDVKTEHQAIETNGTDSNSGITPTMEISSDGFWVINGVKTEYKAKDSDGKDGVTSTIDISDDGYWVINGVTTSYKATVTVPIVCQHRDANDDDKCDNCDTPYTDGLDIEVLITVTFDSDGGTYIEPQTLKLGSKVTEPHAPTKEGYSFLGWYIGDEMWSFIGYSASEDMTLTAKWSKDNYEVIFDYGSSTFSQTLENGVLIPVPQTPAPKDHYSFVGWEYHGVLWSFENDTVKSDMTLTAKWTPVVYTISYELNGGTNDPNNPAQYTVEDLPLTLKAPKHSDKYFYGWFNNPGMTDKYSTIDISNCGNITLYAFWTENVIISSWTNTNLIFEINENSNNSELESTSGRYLAGDMTKTTEGKSTIDTLVAARNANAYMDANVTVLYTYLPDTAKYVWGQNIDRISGQVTSGAANAPDIYCNFVYDMVAASLKQSFANLLSTTMNSTGKDGVLTGAEHNYFAFEDEIDIQDNGKNYMTDYMRSLTLSKYKMYLLASDYFIDLMRAAYVVPVNITLLESLGVNAGDGNYNSDRINAATGEVGKDGKFTIDDFNQLVYDREWTYETLAAYSNAIYSNTNTDVDGKDLGDRLGFALATPSGLSASGMLYSTSIVVIDRELNVYKGDYTYAYPGTVKSGDGYIMADNGQHIELENLCDALSALFRADGVLAVDNSEAIAFGSSNALRAIRTKFANNTLLFGGVICLGSLEYYEYKAMNVDGSRGYGVAPVPLYRGEYQDATGATQRDEYLTQIHNIGRIGAISYTTKKFAQCTAFLDYQCMHSNEILNAYYDYKFQYDVGNTDVKGNVEMLKYIRYNVRSSFDKTYDDILGFFYNNTTEFMPQEQIWHYIIKDSYYTIDGNAMRIYYAVYAPVKAQRLDTLENSIFPTLPN